nr:conserved hypothetical protein [uncultured archaeon]
MKTYFLDTSALVKRYHQEVGTDTIDKIFGEEGKVLFISDLSIIEFHSAIALKVRTREISRDALFHLIGLFSNELDMGLYRVMRIDEAQKQEAVKLLTKYGFDYALRTLDSLQLAAMESVGKEKVDGVVCADARFCEIIRLEGFHVINPEESERITRC